MADTPDCWQYNQELLGQMKHMDILVGVGVGAYADAAVKGAAESLDSPAVVWVLIGVYTAREQIVDPSSVCARFTQI
jgi:hypothetical protein